MQKGLSISSQAFVPSSNDDSKGQSKLKPTVKEFIPTFTTNTSPPLKPTVKEFVPSTVSLKPTVKEFVPSWEVKDDAVVNSNYGNLVNDDQQYADMDITNHTYEEEKDFPYVDAFRKDVPSIYVPSDLRNQMAFENSLLAHRIQPSDPGYLSLPITIHNESYHSITYLPSDGRKMDSHFPTISYKATRVHDASCYVIRRVIQSNVTTEAAQKAIQPWLEMQRKQSNGQEHGVHPSIVGLRDVFQTQEFTDHGGGPSLCIIYDYLPGCITLESKYFTNNNHDNQITEDLLWSYLCQLMTAVGAIHDSGLACRGTIHSSKILVSMQHRLKLNCCGLVDILGIRVSKPSDVLFAEDIVAIGKIIVSLACQSMKAVQNLSQSIRFVERHYSFQFTRVLVTILSKHERPLTYTAVLDVMSERLMMELTNAYTSSDSLRTELAKEVQNGRLLRLVVTMGFINERPEYKQNLSWAETENRYLLKLFRDYVFHQVDSDGNANIDMGHVIDSLNQLDAGTQEKILLMSRDQENMIITTFGEMKKNMVDALQELRGKSTMEILAARSRIDVDMNGHSKRSLGLMQPMHR